MRIQISLEEILVTGAVLCAVLLAIGITFGDVQVIEGGVIITSLCGGAIIVKVLSIKKREEKTKSTG